MPQIIEGVTAGVKHQQHGFEGFHARLVQSASHLAVLPIGSLLQVVEAEESVDKAVEHKAAGGCGILLVPVVVTQESAQTFGNGMLNRQA